MSDTDIPKEDKMADIPEVPQLQVPEFDELQLGGPDTRGQFDRDQVDTLLRGINPSRVLADGKGHAHVSQQDVTAHLIRTFGFGNFDTRILFLEPVFEHNRTDNNGKPGPRWDVCYRATVELVVRNRRGETVATYENVSTGTAENQKRGDAHDLASKSAVSLALKRCTINLGDQFGLSLYNKGQIQPLVRRTLVMPETPEEAPGETADLQEGIPQQVALGADESDTAEATQQHEAPAAEDAAPLPNNWAEVAAAAERHGDMDLLTELLKSAAAHEPNGEAYHSLRNAWTRTKRALTT